MNLFGRLVGKEIMLLHNAKQRGITQEPHQIMVNLLGSEVHNDKFTNGSST
jgi:hypothetical protein